MTHYAMSKTCGQFGLGPSIDSNLSTACDSLGNMSGVLAAVNIQLTLAGLPTLTDDPVTVTGIAPNVKSLVIVTSRGDLYGPMAKSIPARPSEIAWKIQQISMAMATTRSPRVFPLATTAWQSAPLQLPATHA